MKLNKSEINGIKFYYREGYSDIKTYEEVIGKNTYEKRGLKINNDETWIDAGGNVGAFALLGWKKNAKIIVYEPDPYNCEIIEKNMKLNKISSDKIVIKNYCLVHNNQKDITLFIGNNNNVWRNSIVKNWCGKGIKVQAVNFDKELKGYQNIKIDIEGAEMPILENTKLLFKKMVYEWSFDIDPSLERLWKVIDKQKKNYKVETGYNTICYNDKREYYWQTSWFPPCINVYCFAK